MQRLKMHLVFKEILGNDNVYFQPPESIKINYPAIIYGVDNIANMHADDLVYASTPSYWAILIDKNPDSPFVEVLNRIPTSKFISSYVSQNLNHWRFLVSESMCRKYFSDMEE